MTSQLRALLDDAADARPPVGVAARAVREASRRRRRAVAIGSLLTAAAMVVGGAVALRPVHHDVAPQPVDVAAVPLELPAPARLPTLSTAPMDAASVAYVVDGELVLVSAVDGHATVAPSDGLTSLGVPLAVTLSPDGRYAVVEYSWPPTVDAIGRPLALLDVAQGEQTLLQGVFGSTPPADRGIRPQLVTWAPDASWFACACAAGAGGSQVRLVERIDAQDGTVDDALGWRRDAGGVSWGITGLAVRRLGSRGLWLLVPTDQLPGGRGADSGGMPLGRSQALVMAGEDLRHFLTASGSRFTVWSGYGGPERGSLAPDRIVMVSDAVKGYLVGTRPVVGPPAGAAASAPVTVRWLSYFNELRDLTRLPAGTRSASFAAAIVGDPTESGAP